MENIFIIALYFVKNLFLVNFVYYIILSCVAFLCAIILLTLIFKIAFKKNYTLKFYNQCFLISLVLYFNSILVEYIMLKKVFKSELDVIISISAFIVLGLLGKILINSFRYKCKKPKDINLIKGSITPNETKPKSIEIISCLEEGATVYNGYVDVKYLKSLIDKLKENNLEYEDEKTVEELEVYLLNFVNRQPNSIERTKLSSYIGDLIKKLAKYNVV
ncbi:MAG: hypothetical protein J6Q58_03020 [Clostridia bacterium]|nr:hypothetical protein [Clostridia bacterium]